MGWYFGLTLPMDNVGNYKGMVVFNSYLGNSLVNITEGYKNWINSNINNDELNVRALMARTNRILNLSECNAYEAPFSQKEYKLSLQMLPSIFPLSPEQDGFEACQNALEWWNENTLNQVLVIGGGRDPFSTFRKNENAFQKLYLQMIKPMLLIMLDILFRNGVWSLGMNF